MSHSKVSFIILFFFFLLSTESYGQEKNVTNGTINVFLDCNRCDRSYIRDKISFINYVRDKEDSQLHLLITKQRTGSGGTEYTLRYIGRGNLSSQNLTYTSPKSDTQDEERKGLVKKIKIGLLPYLSNSPVLSDLDITYEADEESAAQASAQSDKWNYWVFELDGRSYFNGEESRKNLFLSLGASADHVTKDWKVNIEYDYDYNRRQFTSTDSLGNEDTDTFITRGQRFESSVVKSLSDHWSLGILAESFSSSRNNIAFNISGSPAIEYNIFPYEEYAERRISFMYVMSAGYFDYEEETIFDKKSDFLIRPQLRGQMEFTQPWGEIEGRVNASTYLHDITKNRLDLNLELDFRIFRGLSLNLSGRYSLINDQLSIPKGDISDAEQLLDLRQQSTSYSYRGSIGIEYSFGSIYNNIVNPRF
ncbi:hypothetical protein [Fodinibius halophilus]|uniref:DUF481 domain-containing protein n=1 Tax=Fodinibius halophilus TaxID=1736908 RepID=A0A6M1TBW2_9BACT|nr:hypothetical protein [Fodinibius halophilus]NGP89481.1 hypothetical protein [Fodinibius halophilus]